MVDLVDNSVTIKPSKYVLFSMKYLGKKEKLIYFWHVSVYIKNTAYWTISIRPQEIVGVVYF